MKTGVSVHEVMTNQPVTVLPSATIQETAQVMNANNVNSALVVDNDTILGIVTDEDLVRKVLTQQNPVTTVPITNIMTKEVITVQPGIDINEAMQVMRDTNYRRLPVVDGKKLVGLITIKDLLKIEPDLIDIIVEKEHSDRINVSDF